MIQPGFFDLKERLHKIDKNGSPLTKLNEMVDWEIFRPSIAKARDKGRSNVGPKGYDLILLFKILILQSLYNLSDDATEFQILDRHSFGHFLGLHISQKVPDAKTIWLFREDLKHAGIVEELFDLFNAHLRAKGFVAMKGQIVDASIVNAPRQHNSREENALIKEGGIPDWPEHKLRQKDVDARWTKKNGKPYYGYKNHICIDVKYKLISGYAVTDAAKHDSNVFEELFRENTSRAVYADSAYRSAGNLENLARAGYREHIQRKGSRNHPLTAREKEGNRTRSRIRSRVEHVFGIQSQRAGRLLLRSIGLARAKVKIGLRNLAYNIDRMSLLLSTRG